MPKDGKGLLPVDAMAAELVGRNPGEAVPKFTKKSATNTGPSW